jgi:uncharacterized protein (TIGR02284 family)
MANQTSDIRSTLNDLIETLKDGEQGFREAAAHLRAESLRTQFLSYAQQRARFAAELQREVANIGGVPETSGSAAGVLHRGWIGLKSLLTSGDDHSVLAEAEKGEDSAVKNYREALAKDLPRDIHDVIENQYKDILAVHNQVRALRDGTATSSGGRVGQPY